MVYSQHTPSGRSDQTHTVIQSSLIVHQISDSGKSTSNNFVDDEDSRHIITLKSMWNYLHEVVVRHFLGNRNVTILKRYGKRFHQDDFIEITNVL